MAVLERREVGKGSIGLFIDIWCFDLMSFWMPSGRKGVAQFIRVIAEVNGRLDGKDFNLRHLGCGVVDIGGK